MLPRSLLATLAVGYLLPPARWTRAAPGPASLAEPSPPGTVPRRAHSRLAALLLLGELRLAADVDAPAREPRGQSGVLPLLADGQRQLVVGDDHGRGLRVGIDPDLLDLGRLQRIRHVRGRVRRPRHHVD